LLTKKNSDQFINFYAICFIANYAWLFYNGLTFSTFNPIFFTNALDFTTNFLLITNVQHAIINSTLLRVILDLLFFILPLLLVYSHYYLIKFRPTIAIINSLFNLFYCILLSIFTFTTTQQCMPWVLIPLVFCCINIEKFTALIQIFRWVFISIFLSAGLWKLAAGSIFITEHMSAVLLHQHAISFLDGKENKIISALIQYKNLAHFFYIAAFFAEVSFLIGFFTTKYDRYLISAFSAFILLDYFFMEINYFSWIAFIGFLYFGNNQHKKSSIQ
jgi:hypothetical protein